MKQALLYQGILITINQVKESDNEPNDIIESMYDKPQILLQDLLLDIDDNEIQEIWEVNYITTKSSTSSTPHYVVVLKDSTLFCTCMYIINQGMPCRHQYRILLQSNRAIFHIGFIHTRWFESMPSEITNYVIVSQGTKTYTTKALYYIDQIRTTNVYISSIRENVDKKVKFGTTISVAKTCVQVAVAEGVTSELIRLLTQFITKYCRNIRLNIEEVHHFISHLSEIQESSSITIKNNCQRQ